MAWRVAKSLDKLLAQINAFAPNRSKISDGSIGDAAHSSRASDHNPDPRGVVHARDFTHDPKNGFDAHAFVRRLAKLGDRRIKYLISNRQISNPSIGGGRWRPYSGINPHNKHAHVSVVYSALQDNTAAWPGLGGTSNVGVVGDSKPAQEVEDEMKRIRNGSYSKNQVIKAGKTARIRTNANGDYTMGSTKKGQLLNTFYEVGVTGLLQGEKLRIRRDVVDYNSKAKRSTIRHRSRFHDAIGVGNGEYVRKDGVFADGACGYGPHGDERPRLHLEVENLTNHDVTVSYVAFETEGN